MDNGYRELLVLILLFLAMVWDVLARRIPNWLILVGVLLGLALRAYEFDAWGVLDGMIHMLVPCIALFLLYLRSAIGAGDLKLISMISCYLGWGELGIWILISLYCAAIEGVLFLLFGEKRIPLAVALFMSMAMIIFTL